MPKCSNFRKTDSSSINSERRFNRKQLGKIIIAVVILSISSTPFNIQAANTKKETLIAAMLYKLAQNIQWPNQDTIQRYQFHIIDQNKLIYNELAQLAQSKKLYGKSFDVNYSSEAHVHSMAHVIYLGETFSSQYDHIASEITQSSLIVSDGIDDNRNIMINLIRNDKNTIQFEINKANIINQNLGVHPDIILLGGNEIDVATLYRQGQKQLLRQEKLLNQVNRKIYQHKDLISKHQQEANILLKKINQFKLEKQQLSRQLAQQQKDTRAKSVILSKVEKRNTLLNQQNKQQLDKLKKLTSSFTDTSKELKNLKQQTHHLNNTITTQNNKLKQHQDKLSQLESKINAVNIEKRKQEQILKEKEEKLQELQSAVVKSNQQVESLNLSVQNLEKAVENQLNLLVEAKQEGTLLKQENEKKQKLLESKSIAYEQISAELNLVSDKVIKQHLQINEGAKFLQEQSQKISEQSTVIERQKKVLMDIDAILANQRNVTFLTALVAFMIFLFAIALWFTGLQRKKTNKKLLAQKEQLEESSMALHEAKIAAEQASQVKTQFLANISHELRTPLNAILGFSEMLLNDYQDSSQKQKLDIINTSGTHLLHLINDVLDISKIETGKTEIVSERINLHSLFLEISNMFEFRANRKQLQFHTEAQIEPNIYIEVDAGKLRQILINLLENAVKFTDVGKIVLRAQLKNEHGILQVEVEDSGPGINQKELDKIFEPFIQSKHKINGSRGTGLGLAISKSFAELMSGSLEVMSHLGQGSKFVLTLPVETSTDILSSPSCDGRKKLSDMAHSKQLGRRVLVVEDSIENRLLLTNLLANSNIEFKEAENGQQAIEVFDQWYPDFIWMDMNMPVMDGYEATRRIRKMPGGDKVKIFALTANAIKAEQDKILSAGCNDIVHKPFKINEIIEVLNRELEII